MVKPVLFAIDDDISVLEAVVQDLRRQYGATYRVLRAGSGQAALDTCEQLKQRGEVVALFLSDQRMPGMTGIDFLEKAIAVYPAAKRVLLTAYADTETAIRAINTARIDYYLTKPWDPPEEKLYPVLDDLLEAWNTGYKPPFQGIRVIGPRWSRTAYEVRDFLSRNQVPYNWLNPEDGEEARSLLTLFKIDDARLPAVLFEDGSFMVQPTTTDLATKVGLSTQAKKEFYDLLIVGGGPAGLAAAVYASSEGLHTLVIEPLAPGGQAGSSSMIRNYLGFPQGLSGTELAKRAFLQASNFKVEFLTQRATCIRSENQYRFVQLGDGREVSSHAVLLAIGVEYCLLDVPGVESLTGRGVYYGAATQEARSCKEEDVFIVGGANSAGQAAMHFSQHARQVTMLVRGESLEKGMSKYLIDQIRATSNIEVMVGAQVVEVAGEERLETVRISTSAGEIVRPAAGLYIFIGAAPKTEWLPPEVIRDDHGFVICGDDLKLNGKMPGYWKEERDPYLLETSIPGVFAAGDARHGSVKRVASAVGEGSISVQFIHQYLARF